MSRFHRPRFHRPKFRRDLKRRPINVLASCITTLSLYLGLLSITNTIRERYEIAAYFILAAILCDMLDGTVARLTKSTSEFGKELDSLCDLVSFGVAPAVLIYGSYLCEEQMAKTVEGTWGTIMVILFVICGALRLARYNVFQSGHRESFTGLPIPAAGGTVATFVLFAEYIKQQFPDWRGVPSWALGPMTLCLAYLMVSTVRYPKDRLKRLFILDPQHAFRALATFVVLLAVIQYAIRHSIALVLFPLCLIYIVFGVLDTFGSWMMRSRKGAPLEAPAPVPQPVEGPAESPPPSNSEERR